MGAIASLQTLFKKKPSIPEESPSSGSASSLPPDDFDLPVIAQPPLGLMFTAGQAQALHHGAKSRTDAEAVVVAHHEERIRAVTTKFSEIVAGEQQKKQKQKADLEKDILALEISINAGTAGEEIEVESPKTKLLPDNVELGLTAGASVCMVIWSVHTNHAFLHSAAIFSDTSAWIAAVGPMVGAWWLKDPLSSHPSDNVRRTLRSTYAAVAVGAAVAWVATFGHEAGSAATALGDLSTTSMPEDHTLRMTCRALAQLFMEICGGALLFYRTFELFRNEGRGKETRKVYRIREKYQYEIQERDKKRALLDRVEQHLSAIAQWFDTIPHIEKEYVTRAVGLLEQNIATLKGA
jgi:hypothetical protein